jgi:hypothetical protein
MASFLTNKTQTKKKQNHQKAAEWDEWPRMRPTSPVEGIPHDEEPDSKIKKVKS